MLVLHVQYSCSSSCRHRWRMGHSTCPEGGAAECILRPLNWHLHQLAAQVEVQLLHMHVHATTYARNLVFADA